MTEQRAAPPPTAQADRQPADTSGNQQAPRPWRTEGLPPGDPARQRRRWITTAMWIVGYPVLFGMLTVQDRLRAAGRAVHGVQGPGRRQERRRGVCARRLDRGRAEEGRAAAGPTGSHLPAVHDRAADICERRSARGVDRRRRHRARDAARPAARLPHEPADFVRRRFSCSSAFYVWMFRRQQGAMRRTARRRQAEARRSRDGPRHVRRCRRHRRGRGGDQRGRRLPQDPEKYRRLGRPRAERRAAGRARREPARRCWRARRQARPRCRSSARARRSSSR